MAVFCLFSENDTDLYGGTRKTKIFCRKRGTKIWI